jgi:hypothetical protein
MGLLPSYLSGTLVRLTQYFDSANPLFWPSKGEQAWRGSI